MLILLVNDLIPQVCVSVHILTLHWPTSLLILFGFGMCLHGNSGRGFVDGSVVHVGAGAAYVHP